MTPLSRQDVLAHQSEVPWPVAHQVEQDLLLCRSMVALFNDPFLKGQIAMRGGTVLHKVHLAPASRYSEDIDLVVIGDRPEQHIRAAVKRVLHDVLGQAKRWGVGGDQARDSQRGQAIPRPARHLWTRTS